MASSLLMDEPPLCIQPTLALEIGLNEAIFLQQCHYWLNPRFNKNFIDGRYWVHKTLQQWAQQFPFWSDKTIRRVISSLEKLEIVMSYVTTKNFKKTKFYTINYHAIENIHSHNSAENTRAKTCGQNDQIDLPKRTAQSGHNDQVEMDKKTKSYKEAETTNLDYLFSSREKKGKESELISQKMISIWNEIVFEKAQQTFSSSLTKYILIALREQLGGNFEKWETVCKNFKTSKFMMGEVENMYMKPDLFWLVDPKEPRVERVLLKSYYTFDDRLSRSRLNMNLNDVENEIINSCDSDIEKDVRLFVLNKNPAFYQSYFKNASIYIKNDIVHLVASSDFSRDKIEQSFSKILKIFLSKKHNINWHI